MELIKKNIKFISLLSFLLLWITALFFFSPEEIVLIIGIEGGYLFIFLTALVGVSGFASAPFYAMLATLVASGEYNLFLLALIVAPARAFGDSLFFVLGYQGRSLARSFMGRQLKIASLWLQNKPYWITPLVAYAYTALTPLPQDILMIALGLGKTNFRNIFIAVLLGNATFVFLISFFTSKLLLK